MPLPFSLDPRELPAPVAAGRLSVIVTFLEMTTPPSGARPQRPVGDYRLVRADPPTASFYRYLYTAIGEPWLWHERRRWTNDDLASVVRDPRIEVWVLHAKGTPAGYFEIDRREAPAVSDISYFGLAPEFIGCGLGPWFLRTAIESAWEGSRRIKVNTCTFDHPRALPLYQSMGFKPIQAVMREIDDPRVTGLLPRDAAPHIPIIE